MPGDGAHDGAGAFAPALRVLAPVLRSIVDAELAAGNSIVEARSWPPCSVLVLLRRPFARSYLPLLHVELLAVNDPHYWKEEYRWRDPAGGPPQAVACGFR